MNKLVTSSAAVLAVVLSGCSPSGQEEPRTAAPGQDLGGVVATPENSVAAVNGRAITKTQLEVLKSEVAQRRGGGAVPDDKLIDELIKREILRQEAIRKQLDKNPEYQAKIENTLRVLLSQIAAEDFMKSVDVTEEDLKKEYDRRVAAMQRTEYKARHILVDKEEEARDIIKKLAKGAKFADLAKKLSKDPGSKNQGGELGWFSPQQMVEPFSAAVEKLKNGELTQEPVQTQFGWHVIQREESREAAPPAFEAVKEQLKSMLQTQRLQQYLDELMKTAKIERFTPSTAQTPEAQQPGGGSSEPPAAGTVQEPAPPQAPATGAKP